MKYAKESWILAAIGLADLVTTLVWIDRDGAHEANPLFAFFWQQGVLTFVAAKVLFLFGPLFILEWARRQQGRFVLLASRTAIVAYLVLYGAGIAGLNPRPVAAESAPGLQILCKSGRLRPYTM